MVMASFKGKVIWWCCGWCWGLCLPDGDTSASDSCCVPCLHVQAEGANARVHLCRAVSFPVCGKVGRNSWNHCRPSSPRLNKCQTLDKQAVPPPPTLPTKQIAESNPPVLLLYKQDQRFLCVWQMWFTRSHLCCGIVRCFCMAATAKCYCGDWTSLLGWCFGLVWRHFSRPRIIIQRWLNLFC